MYGFGVFLYVNYLYLMSKMSVLHYKLFLIIL